jgi:class 3 adenylate cyclase
MAAEQIVQLLDQYVRTVGNAVFHHGGVIDSVVGDSILVYFANSKQDCATPVRSAAELCQRMDRVNRRRAEEGIPQFQIAIGLEVGEVLLVNVGGKRRMVHTVLGEPAVVARALQDAAAPGEILITKELSRDLGHSFAVEEALPATVKGYRDPLPTRRIKDVYEDDEDEEDLDPPTLP